MKIIPVKEEKNSAKSSLKLLVDEAGFRVYRGEETEGPFHMRGEVEQGLIQFYYALEGNFTYHFGPHYRQFLKEGHYFFFYNPEKVMQFEIHAEGNVKWVAFFISIQKLHSLFTDYATELPFLSGDNINRTIYQEHEYHSSIRFALLQLFSIRMAHQAFGVFAKGKIYEVLSLHFGQEETDMEACPFLKDESNMSRIKKAKEILVERMNEPPSISELSKEVGINEYRLKTGFKEVYGNTVYGFLLDYKLDHARHLLDLEQQQVNEVAYSIGYSNPSHFISAFKKKFGITPKKYLQNK
ncbi:MAG: helix-turn-helix domain-containing protein [Bacteroidetes bacterium]|nr:helix-turn-helix domain-containing protein [Bacteroidota bacterium]